MSKARVRLSRNLSSNLSHLALATLVAATVSGTGLGTIGCSGDTAPSPPTNAAATGAVVPHVFVGKMDGALIALVESETSIVAYTCGQGEAFGSRTGWYLGVRSGLDVGLVNANNGLRLQGNLSESGGSGTLVSPDGAETAWTVEPAREGAGLFDFEDAENLVGFIRTNDGETAGNAIVRVGTVGGTSPAPSPTSSPVSPTSTSPTPTPSVSFDNGGSTRLVPTTPVTVASNRVVTRTGPVVVFLVHGMSDNIGTKTVKEAADLANGACDAPRNTPLYGRCEWGQDFLPGLFGTTDIHTRLQNLAGRDVTGDAFLRDEQNRPPFDENLGRAVNTSGCWTSTTAGSTDEVFDPAIAQHFVTRVPTSATAPKFGKGRPPLLSAFVTYRDSTSGLVSAGRRVSRQIYAALRWYETTFAVTPGVILVSQSFGGLASRFLLSRPTPAELTGERNIEKVAICKEDLAKMDYVRDRTLYLLTLATPHEGSYMAEWGVPAKTFVTDVLTKLRQNLTTNPLAASIQATAALAGLLLQTDLGLQQKILDGIDSLLAVLKTPALTDLRLARMQDFNLGPLSPEKARRTGSSPILGAQKALVPIYTTLARSPGSDAFDSPDLKRGFTTYATKRPKAQGWITSTMFLADMVTRQFVPHGYGDATVAPYGPFQDILDRRARLFDASPTLQEFEAKFASDIEAVLATVSPWFEGLLGRNGAAVFRALGGDVTVNVPKAMVPIHTKTRWRIGFNGTTAPVPVPALECQGRRIPLDFTPLARALVTSFGTTQAVIDKIAGGDLNAVFEALGQAVANDNQLAQEVASWFVDAVAATTNLPAECNAAPDNPFDVFSLGELANWKVVAATGQIPVPVWIDTGEQVRDGEMDNDGCVHSASALGFTLGRQPFYFEHDRRDAPSAQFASWYRLYDNPVAEKYNHGLQYSNDVGLWIAQTFLNPRVGPVPAPDSFSVWPE